MQYSTLLEPRPGATWGLELWDDALTAAGLKPPLAANLARGEVCICHHSRADHPLRVVAVHGHWEAQLDQHLLCAAGLRQCVVVTAEPGLIRVT